MIYDKYKYIYPPRPKNPVPQDELEYYESKKRFMVQPKLNGSNCVVFTNGEEVHVMNRHGEPFTSSKITNEIKKLYRGTGWMILNGEVLNKNQDNSFGNFNHKFVLFDILAYNGVHLIGSTFKSRIELIYELYGENTFEKDNNLNQISENIFSVKTFYDNFNKKFEEIVPIPVYEGLVIKRFNSKLQNGTSELNNHTSQVKCRKETKNYKF
jgi:ATP-dependent DNA ligase